MIAIRQATPEDVPLIADLIKALAEYEKLAHEALASPEALREHLFGARPYAEALLAHADGQPAGFALYFFNFSTFRGQPGLYLEDLFVRPEFRRLGVGKRLLQTLAATAVERGCGRMEWAVLDWNEPAIGFYKRLGARPMDEWTVYRLDDHALARLANSALCAEPDVPGRPSVTTTKQPPIPGASHP